MAGQEPSALAHRLGALCACAIAVELPNSGLERLRILQPTSCSIPWERRVRRVHVKGAPAVRGALCWAEGECQLLGANPQLMAWDAGLDR